MGVTSKHFALDADLCILQSFPGNDIDGSLDKFPKWLRAYNQESKTFLYQFIYRSRWQVRFDTWFSSVSSGYYLIKRAVGRGAPIVEFFDSLRFVEPSHLPSFPPNTDRPFWIESCLDEWYPELYEGFDELKKDVLGIRDDCNAHGIDLLAMVIPHENLIISDYWNELMQGKPYSDLYDRGKDVRLTEEFLATAGIPLVSLTGPLTAHPDPKSLYYRINGHFTPAGARFVAGLLRDAIIARYFPSGPPGQDRVF